MEQQVEAGHPVNLTNSILIRNIFHMLTYAFRELHMSHYQEMAGEKFDRIADLLAEIIFRGVSSQIKQGLYREYVGYHDALPVVRGHIDMNGTMHCRSALRRAIACEFDDLSVDNRLNRILKSTITGMIYCDDVDHHRKSRLRSLLPFFSEIGPMDLTAVKWSSISLTRNNRSYRMLLNMCMFAAEELLLTTDRGKHRMPMFSDERMSNLYERFVLEYYRTHYPSISAKAEIIEWNITVSPHTDISLMPIMRTDVTLRHGSDILIIDTKYYSRILQTRFGKQSIHSANLYQIFTYVNNMDSGHKGNVTGMLLYARTNEDAIPDMDYKIGNNRFMVRTIDLNWEFRDIAAQLDEIITRVMPDAIKKDGH